MVSLMAVFNILATKSGKTDMMSQVVEGMVAAATVGKVVMVGEGETINYDLDLFFVSKREIFSFPFQTR